MQLRRVQRRAINSVAANRAHMARTGSTYAGQPLWTDEEIADLRSAWPDRARLRRVLTRRSLKAIEAKAKKINLPRKTPHVWTGREAVLFRRLWTRASKREILEAFPFATWTSLYNYAQWQRKSGFPNLRRPKLLPSLTGDPLVDAILEQARLNNMTLAELDAGARTRRYFAAGRHRYRKTWKHLGSAVTYFEGQLAAWFPVNRED